MGNNLLAEEKYRIVIDNYPTQLPARTELGKLLSKQKGREKEAEEVLYEVLKIDKKIYMPVQYLQDYMKAVTGRKRL